MSVFVCAGTAAAYKQGIKQRANILFRVLSAARAISASLSRATAPRNNRDNQMY